MTDSTQTNFDQYAKEWAVRARAASRELTVARGEQKNDFTGKARARDAVECAPPRWEQVMANFT